VEKFGEKVDKSVLLALLPCQRESVGKKEERRRAVARRESLFEEKVVFLS
jgi:hypothetical protein